MRRSSICAQAALLVTTTSAAAFGDAVYPS
jgi:hypothetical protein